MLDFKGGQFLSRTIFQLVYRIQGKDVLFEPSESEGLYSIIFFKGQVFSVVEFSIISLDMN